MKVICIKNNIKNCIMRVPVIGKEYEVVQCEKPYMDDFWSIGELLFIDGSAGNYHKKYFVPLTELYADITASLAKGVQVGDTADQPVRVLN